jgi:hypothetical protein
MKQVLLLAAFLQGFLQGCGGAFFESGSDGGEDVAVDETSSLEASSIEDRHAATQAEVRDAGGEVALERDSSPSDSSPADSAPTCTPAPQHVYSCPSSGTAVVGPDFFALERSSTCSPTSTPERCRCSGAFNCGCLLAALDLASVCQNAQATALTVSCDNASQQPTVMCP